MLRVFKHTLSQKPCARLLAYQSCFLGFLGRELDYLKESGISGYSWGESFNGGVRPDSGRLLAVKHAIREVQRAIRKWQLPRLGWIARETLAGYAEQFHDAELLPSSLSQTSLRFFRDWLGHGFLIAHETDEDDLGATTEDDMVLHEWTDDETGGRREDLLSIKELIAIADDIIDNNGGDIEIEKLRISGYDISPQASHPGILSEDRYSPAQKLRRIKELLEVGIDTYRKVCEEAFWGLSFSMLYACGPFRAVAFVRSPELDRDNYHRRRTFITWWLEPRETWGDPAEVTMLDSRSDDRGIRPNVELVQQYARLGRPPWAGGIYSGGLASWRAKSRAVTQFVRRLLKQDLERIGKLISSAG